MFWQYGSSDYRILMSNIDEQCVLTKKMQPQKVKNHQRKPRMARRGLAGVQDKIGTKIAGAIKTVY